MNLQQEFLLSRSSLTTTASPMPPALVEFDGKGSFVLTTFSEYDSRFNASSRFPCPDTHFWCPSNEYCLPVFVLCNDVVDCPGALDETDCISYACPGYFRCRMSRNCLHFRHVCDGIPQCALHDDEMVCDFSCPANCSCYGYSFFCNATFNPELVPHLRFVEARRSGLSLKAFRDNVMLIHLGLAECGITNMDSINLPNLHSLDLKSNKLVTLYRRNLVLSKFDNLRVLILKDNPLATSLLDLDLLALTALKTLDLSHVKIPIIDLSNISFPVNLQELNLSFSGVSRVTDTGFRVLTQLRKLDLRGCTMDVFPPDVLKPLQYLQRIDADNFKLCCKDVLPPDFNLLNCHAPSDKISSCADLLFSDGYRLFLAGLAMMTLFGNLGSFFYRSFLEKRTSQLGFNVFVIHLCLSDFLMGMYLAFIGIADRWFMGVYLWNDSFWKGSALCKTAGFIALVSCEVSAFIICLITLDRFLVLHYPFSQLHFRPTSAQLASSMAWMAGTLLGVVPFLHTEMHSGFYGQSGICVPLPFSKQESASDDYAFGVMIMLNFILFVLIAVGQVFIYRSVSSNLLSVSTTRSSNDHNVAYRLFVVAMSDFLCWFPIGFVGLLGSQGAPVSTEINVAMAIFVLPLNSAINPFLYTLNVILEKRRQAAEERLHQYIKTKQIHT